MSVAATWFLLTYYGGVIPMDTKEACLRAATSVEGSLAHCVNSNTGEVVKGKSRGRV
jgi:hypothetical protein